MRTIKRRNKLLFIFLTLVFILTLWSKPVSALEAPSVTLPIEQLFEVRTGDPGGYMAKSLRAREIDRGAKSKVELNDIFRYTLKTSGENSPMPTGSTDKTYTFALKGQVTADIGPIVYKTTGHYEYQVAQIIPENPDNYILDKQVYKLDVYVKEKASGGLSAQSVITGRDGRKRSVMRFANQFNLLSGQEKPDNQSDPNEPSDQKEKGSPDVKSSGHASDGILSDMQTGDTSNLAIWGILILISGSAVVRITQAKK